jgi:hypothetical protein
MHLYQAKKADAEPEARRVSDRGLVRSEQREVKSVVEVSVVEVSVVEVSVVEVSVVEVSVVEVSAPADANKHEM